MRVLMVLSQPPGLSAGTDARVDGISKSLRKLGVELMMFTPVGPSLSQRAISRPELLGGIWNPLLISLMASFKSGQVSEVIRDFDPDVIQLEQELAGLMAPKIGRCTDAPVVMDYHGIWPEELVAAGRLSRRSFPYRWIMKIERAITESVDRVTVVSEEMKRYVMEYYGCNPSSVSVVPNAAIPWLESRQFKEKTDRIVYAGTVTWRENIQLLAEALISVGRMNPPPDIHVSTRGEAYPYLRRELTRNGIQVSYDWVPGPRFFDFLETCDVGLIPSSNLRWRQMATPAKLYDYLSAGVPVVATDIGASWSRLIEENKVGFLTENNPGAFAKAVTELSRNPDLVHELGNRAISLVRRELNYDASVARLLAVYRGALRS